MTEPAPVDKSSEPTPTPPTSRPDLCERCGKRHKYPHTLTSKDRGWWALTGINNIGLLVVVALPLIDGVLELFRPTAHIKLTGAQQAALNAGFEANGDRATTVHKVTAVLDHPSILDRLIAAGPSLVLAGLLAFLAYALWRVEVNMTAGPHQRPFTEKDERYLTRASRYLWGMWWVLAIPSIFGGFAVSLGITSWLGSLSSGSLVVMGLGLLVGSFARVYRKGRRAYNDLEKIV